MVAFDAVHRITFGATTEADFYVACPVLANGWTILGEAEKLVPVSANRLESFSFADANAGGGVVASVTLLLIGSEGRRWPCSLRVRS